MKAVACVDFNQAHFSSAAVLMIDETGFKLVQILYMVPVNCELDVSVSELPKSQTE